MKFIVLLLLNIHLTNFATEGASPPDSCLNDFPPPARLRAPLIPNYTQIHSAGPQEPYLASRQSLTLPLLSINDVDADAVVDDIREGLQHVMQTKNEFILAIQGTGTTAAHAVFDNLIEPGDKILIGINGYWGELAKNMSERLGAKVVTLQKIGAVISAQEVETALRIHRPQLVAMVQGESSVSIYQPLREIGELCERYGALLITDFVAVVGIQPTFLDKQKIDAAYASSSKGLGGIVGLSLVVLSPRALAKVRNRKTLPRAYQTDLLLQARLWNTSDPDRIRFQSSSLPALYSLREALATIVREGAQNTFERHISARNQLERGLTALNLTYYTPNPAHRLTGITIVKPPPGKSPVKIADYMFQKNNMEISTGFGPTHEQVLRFAVFAANADPIKVTNLLNALTVALNSPDTDG